jgi:quinol monooxygenase YgiN
MRTSEEVRFVIEIEVHGDVDRFKEVVQACVEVSRSEPGTLVYDWYLDEDRKQARLYEAYESVDAVKAHASGPVFTDVGLPLMELCRFVHMDAFGDVGDLVDTPFWPTTVWGAPFVALKE